MSKNTLIGKNDCEYLRVVLFCKGRGADKDSYRPRSDEKQWWGRRDALARCVSSFLCGANPREGKETKKELVFLFDEDLSRLHMTIDGDDSNGMGTFPKEETLIKLWKQAAQNLRKEVTHKGLKCVMHMDPTLTYAPNSSSTKTPKKTKASSVSSERSSIERIDTKREVLEYIQKHCSIDFLRMNRINSHPEVVLRKTNRKALLKIWNSWTEQMHSSSVTKDGKRSIDDDETSRYTRQLGKIYKELLQFSLETTQKSSNSISASKGTNQIIAGTLHESSEEFPCFRFGPEEIAVDSSSRVSYHICLFLGAVRDMTSNETDVLQKVCEASKIPFVGVRFGRVPEFTSKILSLLAFHHANQVLGISMKRLLNATNKKERRSRSTTSNDQRKQQSTCLNIVCTVQKSSKEISIRLEDRDQFHWRLVRVIVCSLWRSKLASSKLRISHTNTLYLVFEDGIIVALKEREFVEQLASKHQAAPSEFQILTALIHEIDRQSKSQEPLPRSSKASNAGGFGEWSRKKLAKRLVKSILKSSPITVTCTVGIESNASDTLVSRFYDHASNVVIKEEANGTKTDESPDQGLLVVIDVVNHPGFLKHPVLVKRTEGGDSEEKPPREIYRQLLSISRKLQVPTIQQRLLPSTYNNRWCWDREAVSIVAIQHMCYQNRVFSRSCCLPNQGKPCQSSARKRKKPS